VQQNSACQQLMLEAESETRSLSKNPKLKRREESILGSEQEDAETSADLQDNRLPSPHSNRSETPGFPPVHQNSPITSHPRNVTIEDNEGIDAGPEQSLGNEMSEEDMGFEFIENYPAEAGTPGPGKRRTPFEKLKRAQKEENKEPWRPFANKEEWKLDKWLMTAGVSQARVDEFLKLSIVSAVVQTHLRCRCLWKSHSSKDMGA
jgi:hypothetical protein